ncbi:MAG: carbon-nitrogen hydrolase family protein [Candidatus Bipolaricaulota bacterium]|nr:carbon-nitrogen hydrolase family protein [Candidatus Bipolaricaulota bacterium]MDW8328541.1 carbon-nitrogen hydrolase family protein [Candidatus Bipolaricaulota bacterium]
MRLCLIPLKITPRDVAANLAELERRLREVAPYRPDLVCLPECAFTGYLYEDADVTRFAEPIPGPTTERMGTLAREHKIFLCFGLLEVSDKNFFNSAVLLDRHGKILLHHRKICEHPPFTNGTTVHTIKTELGSLSVLICGDLFDEDAISQLDRSIDLLLVPMARSFDKRSPDIERWLREERQVYLDGVKAVSIMTAIVNALEVAEEDVSFGGALIVDRDGRLLAESLHGTDEALVYDLAKASKSSML